MFFQICPPALRVPSLMDAMDPGAAWTEVTLQPQPCPPQGHERGAGSPQAAPRLGMDPALGQPSCLDTAPANMDKSPTLARALSLQCPGPLPTAAPFLSPH